MNSKSVGERTEGIILAHMLRRGYSVLIPFGNNQRYDLVVDKGSGRLIKGQCKTARLTNNGCFRFSVASKNGFTGKRTPYAGQIDVFWVYLPANESIYEVPVDAVGINECQLRLSPAKKGSAKSRIRWGRDFMI